jgi:hypothetical protein
MPERDGTGPLGLRPRTKLCELDRLRSLPGGLGRRMRLFLGDRSKARPNRKQLAEYRVALKAELAAVEKLLAKADA